jgi:hypothetical protein
VAAGIESVAGPEFGGPVLTVATAGSDDEDGWGNMKGVEILGGVNSGARGLKEKGGEKFDVAGPPLTVGPDSRG